MGNLQKIGANILWFLGLFIFLAQTYRAVAYYIFNTPIDWTWEDGVLAIIAFAVMFIPAKLKSIVLTTVKSLAGKVSK